jgi:hypothetical protein
MKLALAATCALSLACAVSASGLASQTSLSAPTGLHPFISRADEPVKADHTYAQMPAFAWNVVRGATSYELQLATSQTFTDASVVTGLRDLRTPVTTLQLQVPWMTGHPYALWVRVRAVGPAGPSKWGSPFGFNTAWQELPVAQTAPQGLIRWSTVGGATGYEVWFPDIGVHYRTLTNVGDEREFWTWHAQSAAVVHWRVRAVRFVSGAQLPDKVAITQYGPYSPVYTTLNDTTRPLTPLTGTDAISTVDSSAAAQAHALTPGFAWSGSTGIAGESSGDDLYRVYVSTDAGCVNWASVGSIVGGPAWAPRDQLPMTMPLADKEFALARAGISLGYGMQGEAYMADLTPVSTAEAAAGAPAPAAGSAAAPATAGAMDPGTISLPDRSWPTGRYWWTVVPVRAVQVPTGSAPKWEYFDLEQPQDTCLAGRVWSFGMSNPAVAAEASQSGLSGSRVTSSARASSFTELPVVTWKPALGAQSYEIELSRKLYPWVATRHAGAVVPSVTLPLTKKDVGVWYYRVRGVNPNLPGTATKLAWSKPVKIRITGDVFTIVK